MHNLENELFKTYSNIMFKSFNNQFMKLHDDLYVVKQT